MKSLDGTEWRKSGLPTYCYCNYRLLRAMQLASADELIKLMGRDFNPYWFKDMASSKETLTEVDVPSEKIKVYKVSENGLFRQISSRTRKVDLSSFQDVPNFLRRALFSSKVYGNPMDCLVCIWFSMYASHLNFTDQSGVKVLNLSDFKSPGTYMIEFCVDGQKYRIQIVGVRTPRNRRGKKTGKTVRNSLSAEQTQTSAERNALVIADAVKRAQSVKTLTIDERDYGPR